MNLETAVKNLTAHGFSVRVFRTAQDAANAISQELSGKTVGFGGSVTLEQMQLFETLQKNNTVYWHWKQTPAQALENARSAQVYLTSANAVSETGEIVNIDGTGNRVASMRSISSQASTSSRPTLPLPWTAREALPRP